jgi:GNAT superfamily N-acetyltransferase
MSDMDLIWIGGTVVAVAILYIGWQWHYWKGYALRLEGWHDGAMPEMQAIRQRAEGAESRARDFERTLGGLNLHGRIRLVDLPGGDQALVVHGERLSYFLFRVGETSPCMSLFATEYTDLSREIEIQDIVGTKGKGYGSVLLRELLAYATSRGAPKIRGWLSPVDAAHRDLQLAFYKKHGFAVTLDEEEGEGHVQWLHPDERVQRRAFIEEDERQVRSRKRGLSHGVAG